MGQVGQLREGWTANVDLLTVQAFVSEVIEFPDVSYYQGNINWAVMSSKTKNIIIRAGQQTWVDSKWVTNWPTAKSYGMKRGCYWFYDGRASPEHQWDVLRQLLQSDHPENVVWVDWEHNYGGPYEGISNVVKFMKMIENAGYTVGIYTGYYYFIENSNANHDAAEYDYLMRHVLWLAQYTDDGSSNHLLVPPPWNNHLEMLELHQYGTPVRGIEFGCESQEIDMNRVINNTNGRYLPGGSEVAPTPIDLAWWKVINTNVLNIRNQPGGSTPATDIGDLPLNAIVLADKNELMGTTLWYHYIDARLNADPNGTPIATSNGQLVSQRSDCWSSGSFLVKTTLPVPQPEPPPATDGPEEVTVKWSDGKTYKATNFVEIP